MTDHHNYHSPPEFYDILLSDSIKLESNQSNLITNMDSLSSNPMLTTASMPIPQRNNAQINRVSTIIDYPDYIFDLEASQSPQMVQDISYTTNASGGTMYELQSSDVTLNSNWSEMGGPQTASVATKQEYLMEEEDIFQVDKADLIQGPTLAELNGDNLYVDLLNIDEIIAAEELSPQMTHLDNYTSAIQSSPCLPIQIFSQAITTPQTPNNSLQSSSGFYDDQTLTTSSPYEFNGKYQSTPTNSSSLNNSTSAAFSPGGSSSSPITLNSSSVTPPPPAYFSPANSGNVGIVQHNPKYTTLHELLMKKNDAVQFRRERQLGQSVPANGNGNRPAISPGRKLLASLHPAASRLSSSAPTHLGLEQIWARREPRPHLLSTGKCSPSPNNFWGDLCHDDEFILGSLAEAGSTSSLSTGGVLSPEAPDLSQDENSDIEDSDDHYDDYSTDNGIYA